MSSQKLKIKALIKKIEKLAPEELQEIKSVIERLLKPSSEQAQEALSSPAQPEKGKEEGPENMKSIMNGKRSMAVDLIDIGGIGMEAFSGVNMPRKILVSIVDFYSTQKTFSIQNGIPESYL